MSHIITCGRCGDTYLSYDGAHVCNDHINIHKTVNVTPDTIDFYNVVVKRVLDRDGKISPNTILEEFSKLVAIRCLKLCGLNHHDLYIDLSNKGYYDGMEYCRERIKSEFGIKDDEF